MDSSCSQVKLIDATYLPCLRHLSINHCALEDLTVIDGLHTLRKLESLSFAHNFLSYEAFLNDGPFLSLTSLKKLDLGYNLLTEVPTVIISLYNLETLVLVENNITELPASLKNLKKLTTLCIDGNLLTDIDNCLEHISQLKSK
jgi:Leucine-rich repeat (LRR) protein